MRRTEYRERDKMNEVRSIGIHVLHVVHVLHVQHVRLLGWCLTVSVTRRVAHAPQSNEAILVLYLDH